MTLHIRPDPDVEEMENEETIVTFVIKVMTRKRFPWTTPMVDLFNKSYESLLDKDPKRQVPVDPGALHLRMIHLSSQCYSVHIKHLSVDDVRQRLRRHEARLKAESRKQQQQQQQQES